MSQKTSERWIPADSFGDRLRRLRRAVTMTQADFAHAIDATPQALAAWELGTRAPRSVVAVAKRIELAFNVPASWVLGLEMQEAPGPDGPEGVPTPLPRLDSNQQPSGYRSSLVRHLALVA